MGITRRQFLLASSTIAGAAALGLSLHLLRRRPLAPLAASLATRVKEKIPSYGDWQDLYRVQWTWDRISKGTHFVNCWYQRGCNWNVYVKDGVVFREEQVASYEQTNPEVPDFNPRGCQKGACYSLRMTAPSRLLYPLKRVGARGEGRWKRISWQDGLREVAKQTLAALREDGAGSIVWDPGTANANGCNGIGAHRTSFVLDTPVLNVNCEVGDHHPGAMATLGKISFASSGDDLFYSDLILIWGGNPAYTQIPNAHFINEARYHGAEVIVIAPDLSASAIHADIWLPVSVGSDAALALGIARVLLEEDLIHKEFVREQTDLPLLVRKDTKKFLRKSDLEKKGSDEIFYCWNEATNRLQEVDTRSLSLKSVIPALAGSYTAKTLSGSIEVEPALEGLRRQVQARSLEEVEAITGCKPEHIQMLARKLSSAKAATMITQSNFSKFYHGLEMERTQILLFALTGQMGRRGAGFNGFPSMTIAGATTPVLSSGDHSPKVGALLLAAEIAPRFAKAKLAGHTDEMILYDLTREEYRGGRFLSGMLFHYLKGGLDETYGATQNWDKALKRPLREYLDEAIANGWQISPPDAAPRIFFEVGGNVLRRTRGYDRLIRNFLPKLDLLVTLDWRMSNTALHSDYIFPAASWYEKDDITWATPIAPFAHVTTRAVAPLAEAKTDWEFHCLFLKELQSLARKAGGVTYLDRSGAKRELGKVYDQFTFGNRFHENNAEDLLRELIGMTTNLGGLSWDELKERGFARYTSLGMDFVNIGNATDIQAHETIVANQWHVQNKMPWPTLTRRIQFYIDHPFYLELGEELPVHKEDPRLGGDYPLAMTGQHARWSIHASWRDESTLLRLQRGEPVIVLSAEDAKKRHLEDGDLARAFNDIGEFQARIKISPATRPGQVVINHAWEPYQFKAHRSHQSTIPSPINPIQLAGGYRHLQPTPLMGEAGSNDRGTRIEIERLDATHG